MKYGDQNASAESNFLRCFGNVFSAMAWAHITPVFGHIDLWKTLMCWMLTYDRFCVNTAGKRWIFQDDKLRHHVSIDTSGKPKTSYEVWRAQSPDINIIENVGKVIKSQAQKEVLSTKPRKAQLLNCWKTKHTLRHLYEFIPRRIYSVIVNN